MFGSAEDDVALGGWLVMSSLCRLRSRKFLKLRCLVGDANILGGDIELARYDAKFLPESVLPGIEPSPSDSELDDPIKPAPERGGDDGAAKNDVLDADRPCRGLCPTRPGAAEVPEGFPG